MRKLHVVDVLLTNSVHINWWSVQKSIVWINVTGVTNFLVLRLRICWSALPNIKESVRKYALRRSI